MPKEQEPTQWTRPQEGEPVEIPVPKRSTWDRLLHKVAHPETEDDAEDTDPGVPVVRIEDEGAKSGKRRAIEDGFWGKPK